MGKIQWNLWARAWVLAGAWTGAFFAISCMFYTQDSGKVDGRYLAYYLWALSVILGPFFFPIKKLGAVRILFANHLVCAIVCVLIAPFCFVRQPGIIPGFCYGVAAILFIAGFLRGEKTESLDELRGKPPARS